MFAHSNDVSMMTLSNHKLQLFEISMRPNFETEKPSSLNSDTNISIKRLDATANHRYYQIVALPYPLLLQRSAREALNLNLKGHIVIIDEAHNLMDAIANIHSVSITLSQLKQSRSKLGLYLQKFRNRLKGKNRVYVTQLVRLLDSLAGYLSSKSGDTSASEGPVHVADLLAGKGVDQINLYKLMGYLQESKLARKVEGYHDFAEELERQRKQRSSGSSSSKANDTHKNKAATMPVLMHVQSFLLALTYPSAEGRFFYSNTPATGDAGSSASTSGGMVLKYLLLDTTHHFKEIVEEARAVILAGGTMSPVRQPLAFTPKCYLQFDQPRRVVTNATSKPHRSTISPNICSITSLNLAYKHSPAAT